MNEQEQALWRCLEALVTSLKAGASGRLEELLRQEAVGLTPDGRNTLVQFEFEYRRDEQHQDESEVAANLTERFSWWTRAGTGGGPSSPVSEDAPPGVPTAAIGQVYGDFTLLRPLDPNGRGMTWECTTDGSDRYAIKLAAPHASTFRFYREVSSLRQLRHANVIEVLRFSLPCDGRRWFFVMPLAEMTVAEYVATQPLSIRARLELARAVASAFSECSKLLPGFVHRDIKPENLLLMRRPGANGYPEFKEQLRIADLGLAFRDGVDAPSTQTRHHLPGTPGYMDPWATPGSTPSTLMDVYGFGATLHFLLFLRPPVSDAETREAMFTCTVPAQGPNKPSGGQSSPALRAEEVVEFQRDGGRIEDLDTLLRAPLSQPDDRQESFDEILDDLGRLLGNQRIRKRPVPKWKRVCRRYGDRLGSFVKKRPRISGVIGTVIFVGVLSAVGWGCLAWAEGQSRARDLAKEAADRNTAEAQLTACDAEVDDIQKGLKALEDLDITSEATHGQIREALDLADTRLRATRRTLDDLQKGGLVTPDTKGIGDATARVAELKSDLGDAQALHGQLDELRESLFRLRGWGLLDRQKVPATPDGCTAVIRQRLANRNPAEYLTKPHARLIGLVYDHYALVHSFLENSDPAAVLAEADRFDTGADRKKLRATIRGKKLDEATKFELLALAQQRLDADAALLVAGWVRQCGGKSQAEEVLASSLARSPHSFWLNVALGSRKLEGQVDRRGDLAVAVMAFAAARATRKTDWLDAAIVETHLARGHIEAALDWCLEAQRTHPKSALVARSMCDCYRAKHDHTRAVQWAKESARLDPSPEYRCSVIWQLTGHVESLPSADPQRAKIAAEGIAQADDLFAELGQGRNPKDGLTPLRAAVLLHRCQLSALRRSDEDLRWLEKCPDPAFAVVALASCPGADPVAVTIQHAEQAIGALSQRRDGLSRELLIKCRADLLDQLVAAQEKGKLPAAATPKLDGLVRMVKAQPSVSNQWHAAVGRYHLFRREYDQAIRWLWLASEANPFDLPTHESFFQALVGRGFPDDRARAGRVALACLHLAQQQQAPDEVEARCAYLYATAVTWERAKQEKDIEFPIGVLEYAAGKIKDVAGTEPLNASIARLQARLWVRLWFQTERKEVKYLTLATDAWKRSGNQHQSDVEVLLALARALEAEAAQSEGVTLEFAQAVYLEAYGLDKNDPRAIVGNIRCALLRSPAALPNGTETEVQKQSRQHPDSAALHHVLAEIMARRGPATNKPGVLFELLRAVTLDPNGAEAWAALAKFSASYCPGVSDAPSGDSQLDARVHQAKVALCLGFGLPVGGKEGYSLADRWQQDFRAQAFEIYESCLCEAVAADRPTAPARVKLAHLSRCSHLSNVTASPNWKDLSKDEQQRWRTLIESLSEQK